MATKSFQMKKLLKLPKEAPSNIIIRVDNKVEEQAAAAVNSNKQSLERVAAELSVQDAKKIDFKRVPLFKDLNASKWPLVYIAKCRACGAQIADYGDPKKDQQLKEDKREALIELIDVLDETEASDALTTDQILMEAFKCIRMNLFRTFANKNNKKSSAVDPDEDEPHLEEAWPHLQLVYELLLKFIMSPYVKSNQIVEQLDSSFIKSFLELFDSEDPRERDYLKTILHRIYGKYMALRPDIKKQIMDLFLVIMADADSHNGLTELLEILSSITSGLSVPLKVEHQEFFKKVLIPLHKVKTLQSFNTQLQICIKNYLEKQNSLSVDLVQGLIKFWPLTCPAKEVIFITELEEVIEGMGNINTVTFNKFGANFLKRLLQTSQGMHFQAAERSLLLLNSELIQKMVKNNMNEAYPVIVRGLKNAQNGKPHWNQTVTTITFQVIRTYVEMNRPLFDELSKKIQTDQDAQSVRTQSQASKWALLSKHHNIEEPKPMFPLILYKPPQGMEEAQSNFTDTLTSNLSFSSLKMNKTLM